MPLPPGTLGTLVGTVDGTDLTATFTPSGATTSDGRAISPAIYGNQGVTVTVFGKVDSVKNFGANSDSFYVRVALRNLLAFPIGTNYKAVSPPDTLGVFAFFPNPPVSPVVTKPSPCVGCTATVANANGTANFIGLNEKYFWYRSKPTAKQPSPGTDTTRNTPQWVFIGKGTGSTRVTAFTFRVELSAAWPPPNENQWTVNYVGTNDSLPDTKAEPRWKRVNYRTTLGTESWTAAGLVLNAQNRNDDNFLTRHDSLGPMSAEMDVKVQLTKNFPGLVQGVFGLVEGPAPAKMIAVAVMSDGVGWADTTVGTAIWVQNVGAPIAVNMLTAAHTIHLRKYGQDSAVACVDGVRLVKRLWNSDVPLPRLQPTAGRLNAVTTFFGIQGSIAGAVASTWTSAVFTLGSSAAPC
jgi:hypothetical protein